MAEVLLKRRCPHQARQMQIVNALEAHVGMSAEQLARKLRVSERSVRGYLKVLVKYGVLDVVQPHVIGTKRRENYYSLRRTK